MTDADLQDAIDHYGLAAEDGETLRRLLQADEDRPVALVNLLALEPDGGEAMMRYAAVSGERLRAVGGEFVYQGLAGGSLWGAGPEYSIVVVGRYPNGRAVLELLADPEYRAAYEHRRAAVREQRVLVTVPLA